MCVLNQTSACLNGLEENCLFIQNSTFEEAVESPNTAPDLAEVLTFGFNNGNNKEPTTTSKNHIGVKDPTKLVLSQNIVINNNNFKVRNV